MRLGASRFVAGETLDDCIAVLRRLNDQGLWANTTLLGEGVLSPGQTENVVAAYREIIDRIAAEELRANVALKLTHLGLEIDEELAYANMRGSSSTQRARRLHPDRHGAVGVRRCDACASTGGSATTASSRSAPSCRRTCTGRRPTSTRCCPRSRISASSRARTSSPRPSRTRSKTDVDAAYVRLLETMLSEGGHTAVATHDSALIQHAIRFAADHDIAEDRFEFQMLYGVRPQLQLDLARRGYKVLVATPYGPEWYPYLMRRLGERPGEPALLRQEHAARIASEPAYHSGVPSLRKLIDWAFTIAVALGFVLVFEAEVAKPFRIPSSSMEPTLHCAKPGAWCEARFSTTG